MRSKTATRTVFALLAVVFFATPIALRIVGVTASAFENRPLADPPKLSQGWDAFGQATRYITDHMPLRQQAVRANTRIWTDVFNTDPRYGGQQAPRPNPAAPLGDQASRQGVTKAVGGVAPWVVQGPGGWLFFGKDLEQACHPDVPRTRALARWDRLVRAIRATGRQAIAIVAPDKSSIYPEHVPDDLLDDCVIEGRRRSWQLIDDRPPADRVVGLRDDLLRRKVGAGDDLYARKDSHWTTLGSLSMVEAVLDRFGQGIAIRDSDLGTPRHVWYTGDLTVALGAPEADFQLDQPVRRTPDSPRVTSRALVVGDSFYGMALEQLEQYFHDIRGVAWGQVDLERVAEEIAASDVVIFEVVERMFSVRASANGSVPSLLAEIGKLEGR